MNDQGDHGGRSPLAILRHALTGNLLHEEFVPLSAPRSGSQPEEDMHPRIGIAWESIDDRGVCIPAKSIPREKFLTILDGVDATLISFQRKRPGVAEIVDHVVPDDVIDAEDQTKVVQEILGLDCMVTISTTTAHIAASFGIDVILLAAQRKGPQWFWRAHAEHAKHLYPTTQVLIGIGEDANWWQPCIAGAKAKLSNLLVG